MRKLLVVSALVLMACGGDPSAPVVRPDSLVLEVLDDPVRPSWGDTPGQCKANQQQWIVCDRGLIVDSIIKWGGPHNR